MPNAASLSAIAIGRLIDPVDTKRATDDPFKLPGFLRAAFNTALTDLESKDGHTALTESDRAGGSGKARTALGRLETLLRDGYNGIKAIRSTKITDTERMEVFATYGWVSGNLGAFSDARIIGLARLAVRDDVGLDNPDWRYDPELVQHIKEQLAIFDSEAPAATGAERMKATKARDEALEAMRNVISRVRYYYCCASVNLDGTPELAHIDLSPRTRGGGSAQPEQPAQQPPAPPTPPAPGA